MPSQPPPQKTQRHGLLFANVATLFFGLAGVLGKLSTLPAPLIVLGRVFFAGLTLLIATRWQRVPLRPKHSRDGLLLFGQGVLLAIHWTSFFQSINVSNVAIGLLSFSSFPLFTAVLEPLLLKQPPKHIQILAAVLILPGIYLLTPALNLQNNVTVGVLWGLLAGATFALLSVTNRWLGRRYPSLTISLYQDGVATLVLLPTLILMPTTDLWTWHSLLILLIMGTACTALAHTLFIASMRDITAQLASLIASLEPIWGIIFGVLLLHDIPGARTIFGGIIILCATMLPALATLQCTDQRR